MLLIGYQKVRSHEKDKDPFTYYKLFYTEEIRDSANDKADISAEGSGAGYIIVGESKVPENLSIGCNFKVLYNRFGKVELIAVE